MPERMTRKTKMTAAIKDATTAPLTRWQKSVNCEQTANQFAVELPVCAKYDMEAAAAAAAVVKPVITVSSMRRRSLAPTATGRTMQIMEKGNERTRYPLAMAFAITKYLHKNMFNYICIQGLEEFKFGK